MKKRQRLYFFSRCRFCFAKIAGSSGDGAYLCGEVYLLTMGRIYTKITCDIKFGISHAENADG